MHDGPWFCESCRGAITMCGVANMTQDWPLIDHLWMGWLPQDVEKADQFRHLGEMYWPCSNGLQVLLLATATSPEC